MNLQEIMNQITTLGGQIRQANAKLAQDANNSAVSIEDIEKQQGAIADMQKRMNALQASYNALKDGQQANLTPVAGINEKPKGLKAMLASNEYARAFAYAIRNGITRKNGRGNEKVQILFDALSEGGGSPTGTDGGFLVPEDMDHQIHELRRELSPLASLFTEESVTAPTGWRVIDTAPTTGMTKVDEMGTIPKDDQPAFGKVSYSLDKYGLIVPVSNELLSDEVANLMGYLARWFAKKQVITENNLLITALKTLAASALVSGSVTPDGAIKTILNKTLDPAISARAIIITNQTGFDALDQLVDEMGRGLLQPDPTNATEKKIYNRRVVPVSDAQLPNTTGKPEFFIGDAKEFATLFTKKGLELSSTDIGGDAWAKDMTEVRGISRMCVRKFDANAMVRRQLTLS